MKLTPLSTFFVNFAHKICHMHCIWVYNNEFFIIKWSHIMHVTNSTSKIEKNVLRGVNFTNLKTLGSYIAK